MPVYIVAYNNAEMLSIMKQNLKDAVSLRELKQCFQKENIRGCCSLCIYASRTVYVLFPVVMHQTRTAASLLRLSVVYQQMDAFPPFLQCSLTREQKMTPMIAPKIEPFFKMRGKKCCLANDVFCEKHTS